MNDSAPRTTWRAFHDGASSIWPRTVVLVVSEFGRTVAVNGTAGTDHGTGGLALLAGGAVRGGRIGGDWPGLAPGDLHEGRDLRATTDPCALCKDALAVHLHVPESVLATRGVPRESQRASDGELDCLSPAAQTTLGHLDHCHPERSEGSCFTRFV